MAKARCKETSVDSFFGNFLYDQKALANDSLTISLFLGLGADEKAPDHSTLTLFKNRLVENAGLKAY